MSQRVTGFAAAVACAGACLAGAGCGAGAPPAKTVRRAATPLDQVTCAHILHAGTSSSQVVPCGGPTVIEIEPPAAVRSAGGQGLAQFELGRRVTAQSGCLACHKLAGNGNAGPGRGLDGVGARMSAAAIRQAIVHPREPPMPSFAHLPPERLRALVTFLSLLGR